MRPRSSMQVSATLKHPYARNERDILPRPIIANEKIAVTHQVIGKTKLAFKGHLDERNRGELYLASGWHFGAIVRKYIDSFAIAGGIVATSRPLCSCPKTQTRLRLSLKIRDFLQERIGYRDRARGSLETPLRGDHLYELRGQIHRRQLERPR